MNTDENFESKTKNLFSRWAKWYDGTFSCLVFFERTYRRNINLLQSQNRLVPGVRFLDVACGTGEIIARLAPIYPSVAFTGIDFTPAMIQKAKEKNAARRNVQFQEADVTALPFDDGQFDVALCSDALHHFAHPQKAVQGIHRVLRPGSLFLLVDPAFNNKITHWLGNMLLRKLENAYYYYSPSGLTTLLENNGFTVESATKYYFNNYVVCFKK